MRGILTTCKTWMNLLGNVCYVSMYPFAWTDCLLSVYTPCIHLIYLQVPELPEIYSLDLRTLVQDMMSQQPEARPSAKEIVKNDLLLYHRVSINKSTSGCLKGYIETKLFFCHFRRETLLNIPSHECPPEVANFFLLE